MPCCIRTRARVEDSAAASRSPPTTPQGLVPHQLTRLYLLADSYGVMAIELVDIRDAGTADTYSALVDIFKFATAG